MDEIIKSGVAHGCKSEDLFGCLYFYLSDELNTFIERMRQLNVTFYLFANDCEKLAKDQQSGKLASFGLSASQKYDRIDVSNTVDEKYLGFRKVIKNWGPLLNEQNPSSTLLSYSMNWPFSQPQAMPDTDPKVMERILTKVVSSGLVTFITDIR